MTNEVAVYKQGDHVEVQRSGNGPWEKGKIAMPTLHGTGWMVTFDGEHGSREIPAARIRRVSEAPSNR